LAKVFWFFFSKKNALASMKQDQGELVLIECLAVGCIGGAIMGAQTFSRQFERLVLRFKLRYHGPVVRRFAQGRSLSQPLELVTYCRHRIVDLLAQRLI
jgi:hypothetical protein